MTFSIVARDPDTGHLGVAISTAVPNVGGRCPYAATGVGAVSSQASSNPYLALYSIQLLEQGATAQDALDKVVSWDPGRANRQLHIVDATGGSAAHTGDENVDWCGHRIGDGFSVAGNMLVGQETIDAMAERFIASTGLLSDRLVAALESGQAAGGDKRGRVSAALLVMGDEDYSMFRLQVDEHPDPVAELRRVYEIQKPRVFGPDARSMPRSIMEGHP